MKRIMIVDDRPELFLLAGYLLESEYDLVCHEDALAALEELRSRPVDLIILDYKMPVLNGYEFLQRLRGMSDVPVIICSATRLEHDMFDGMGVVGIVIKPFGIDEFRNAVTGALGSGTP